MRIVICTTMALLLFTPCSLLYVSAQSRFEVPLTVTDGADTQTLYFGIMPGGHFCVDYSDSINGHGEAYDPPWPPSGVLEARFICPRSNCGPSCFDQGSHCDFRPFTSATQRDTFASIAQPGAGSLILASWPSGLSTYFNELRMGNVNMLTDTSGILSTIYSGGLVVSVSQEPPSISHEFALTQNYPNPFNPTTTIDFQLPTAAFVTLRVFDLLGREVTTLLSQQMPPGNHKSVFVASELASGVYICRLDAHQSNTNRPSSFTQTRKLLLLR